ncbi:MarR family winged helix-turn-helix transcriptional regulator [Leptolyngbya sp. NIES-2104]|uniref:MarR family winged helix-turn-helix transcriptional regulator n=1 Tax=Leptolyngbya sp. NIES-2104 TaxID=1552121 RepID=UPI0006EC5C7E|nr:MarR family transcriptional regulator [Leptolyngbya sp. NIES-2104]GAP95608.1 transcriptional regulator, MarR family [Leptolyngbya sp. NIES-2104]
MLSSQTEQIPAHLKRLLAPHGIGYRIKLLSQLLGRRFQERLEPHKLTPFHWVVLCCLWQEDGQATSSIGDRLQQVGGTLTGVLDRMCDRGLIRRERDTQDRRIWRIWLTDSGRQLEDILPPIAVEVREAALSGIPYSEREQFSDVVDRIIANFANTDPVHSPDGWQALLAPHNLGYRIKIIAQLGTRRFQERLDPFELTPFHWVVLCCLWQEDGQATSGIGEKLQQVGGTLTGVLDRMCERGLIRRERDTHDRRIWRIWLTEEGERMKTTLPPVALSLAEVMMTGISTEEQAALSDWVNRAIANLTAV